MAIETLIIGGGISGLHAARLLHQKGHSFCLLEARSDFGGRIRTTSYDDAGFELGPSWFWPESNPRIARFIKECALPDFPQYTEGDAIIDDGLTLRRQRHQSIDSRVARRLTNGSQSLIEAHLRDLPDASLFTDHQAHTITRNHDSISVSVTTPAGEKTIETQQIILALPLRLVEANLVFTPPLPSAVTDSFRETPTWMAGEAKFFAFYKEPFWRQQGLSGTFLSYQGPLSETHDACHPEGPAALFGFFSAGPAERKSLKNSLPDKCIAQIAHYFGQEGATPLHTMLMDWASEPLTATAADKHPPRFHPSYGLHEESRILWDSKIQFAGTEAASSHGGYLEGAFEAAESAVSRIFGRL